MEPPGRSSARRRTNIKCSSRSIFHIQARRISGTAIEDLLFFYIHSLMNHELILNDPATDFQLSCRGALLGSFSSGGPLAPSDGPLAHFGLLSVRLLAPQVAQGSSTATPQIVSDTDDLFEVLEMPVGPPPPVPVCGAPGSRSQGHALVSSQHTLPRCWPDVILPAG